MPGIYTKTINEDIIKNFLHLTIKNGEKEGSPLLKQKVTYQTHTYTP